MSFKENLLKKIRINDLSRKVSDSLASAGEVKKVDKRAMRELLDIAGYDKREERDLELYLRDGTAEKTDIIVLDNELPTYATTVADVALRKSPTVKEMLNIGNAIKILNDKDVVKRKKDETVGAVRAECLETVDLSFTEADIDEIRGDGAASLENGYGDGVVEALALFGEILVMDASPHPFRVSHGEVRGIKRATTAGDFSLEPVIIYDRVHNELKLIDAGLRSTNKEDLERFQNVAKGKASPDMEGEAVFDRLKEMVLSGDRDAG